jgi:alkaline phosphatase
MYKLVFSLFILLLFIYCSPNSKLPKNIILFIGDGMGPAQVTLLTTIKNPSQMERLPVGGLLKTHSADRYVTDSAAGATAYATGYKTSNQFLSVSPDSQSLKTVVEYAEELGKSTGIVVTCEFTHATPAAFVAHVDSRYKYHEIAAQIVDSDIDVIMGGAKGMHPADQKDLQTNEEDDYLYKKLAQKMKIITDSSQFKAVKDINKLAYFYNPDVPGRFNERPTSLKEMTQKAIEILSKNSSGFFLMVEGSQIDWGGHDNEIDYIIGEIKDFDDAIGAGLDFAKDDKNTLVIVTADHETGGLALNDGSVPEKKILDVSFASKDHTAVMVPIFAYGPQSEIFGGIHENIFVGRKIIAFNRKP